MFASVLETNFFAKASEDANKTVIKDDRMEFKPVFDIINEFIRVKNKDHIVVSDINKVLKKTKLQTDVSIYTTQPRKLTTELANTIHEHFGKFVMMRSIIPNKEYVIMANMRNVVYIYMSERYKVVRLSELFNTVSINKIQYFPPYIELIDVFHKLYLPNFYNDWEHLLDVKEPLLKRAISNMNTSGGAVKCDKCKEKRDIDMHNIRLLLMDFFHNENFALVGKWAHALMEGKAITKDIGVVELISENDIERDFKNISEHVANFTDHGLYFKKKKLYIPKDTRIYKYRIFVKFPIIGNKKVDKPLVDIYNCGNFELIPYTTTKLNKINLKLGSPYVQLRFLFVDLWLLQKIKFFERIDKDDFAKKSSYIHSTIKAMSSLEKKKKTEMQYIGINFDEKVEQKIIISEQQITKSTYYPEISMKLDKNYKAVATS